MREAETIIYRVRACNTSADSENRIHDDRVAAELGFRGGLVPGVTVYGYMTAPLVERYGMDYLERGSMRVRFLQPFYEGDQVTVRAEADETSRPAKITITAERDDGTVCATAVATAGQRADCVSEIKIEEYARVALAAEADRPVASVESLVPGAALGTVIERPDGDQPRLLGQMEERLQVYYGDDAVAHPAVLLAMSNKALACNFRLGPWIHAASELVNLGVAKAKEEIEARARIRECFERKGHEFVVLDVLLLAEGTRPVQHVRHTAIYRPKTRS
ncbi:MAG TPA: MaoC family dehydratase [Blastocatellia bacterium]|nr:MaoC family dehydratase [Blastocatellia bacterium]